VRGREPACCVDIIDQRELKVLEAIAEDQRITQRRLAARVGIALGLANLHLKRLIRGGYVKRMAVSRNQTRYSLTTRGRTAKTKLTRQYVGHSLRLYGRTREHFRIACDRLLRERPSRVVLYGIDATAELTYLSLKELGVDPVAVFDSKAGGSFLGIPVRPLAEHTTVSYDVMLVTSIENSERLLLELRSAGVSPAKLRTVDGLGRTSGAALAALSLEGTVAAINARERRSARRASRGTNARAGQW
jgi:DNA-binding MarR family transcriptional regulator